MSENEEKSEAESQLTLPKLREAVLHFLEMAALFEQKHGTEGFREYSYAEADGLLRSDKILGTLVGSILKHREERDYRVRLVRLAACSAPLREWLAGRLDDRGLEENVLSPLRSDGHAVDGAWRARLDDAKAGDNVVEGEPLGPVELPFGLLGRIMNISKGTVANVEMARQGVQEAPGKIKTSAQALALEKQAGFGANELIFMVLVALHADTPMSSADRLYVLSRALVEASNSLLPSASALDPGVLEAATRAAELLLTVRLFLGGIRPGAKMSALGAAVAQAYIRLVDRRD